MDLNVQEAPYPDELDDLVAHLEYRPGWEFSLKDIDRGQGSKGLTFIIVSQGYDTHHPERGETYRVMHYFTVPPAAFNRQSWQRWVLDKLIEVETHECCEFLRVDGEQPFAPNHGPGWDPYPVRELNDAVAASTDFRGRHHPGTH